MVAENEDQQLESCERVGKGYSLSKHSLTYLVYSTLLILKIVKSWVSKRFLVTLMLTIKTSYLASPCN